MTVKNQKKTDFTDLRTVILDNDLCSGCGACVGVCPAEALAIDSLSSQKPVIDETKCIHCGLCYEVCPGKGYPICQLAQDSCDDKTKMHPTYGPVRHCLLGHSTDPDLRLESASGGIATALLVHLLETKQVEAVAVVTMENSFPQVKLTDDPAVVLSAKASKYSPVPMMQIIKDLKKNPRKFAMPVTPCQLAAFLTATQKIKKIRECLVLAVGLFCGQVKDYASVSKIAATLDLKYPGEAEFLGWRCGSYPGSARFKLADGTLKEKPLYPWLDIAVPHYALHRCFLCPDGGNWLADMTLGDIHAGGDDETVIVCRTARGEQFLRNAEEAGAIKLADMTPDQVESCVIKGITGSKLKPALARIQWRQKKGKPVPKNDYPARYILKESPKLINFLNVFKYRLIMWTRQGWKRRFLERHPHLMEKTGHFLYKFPVSLPGWKLIVTFNKWIKRYIFL
jgi:coenzyme F420 hydrogenase subunit beta